MPLTLQIVTDFILSGALILAGLILGLIAEFFVLRRIARRAATTAWRGDEIITKALRGVTTLWFLIGGIVLAVYVGPFPEGIVEDINHALPAVIIISATAALARLAQGMVRIYAIRARAMVPGTSTSFLANLTKLLIYTVGLLLIPPYYGISVTPILTALGVGGLAVALALQDPLSNLFAGLQIIISRPVKPGDYIKLDSGEEGYVVDIAWRNTSIRELLNNLIIIPNTKLATAIIKNYHMPEQPLSIMLEVGVSYASDLARVEQVTIEVGRDVAQEVQGGVPGVDPLIRYHTFGDHSINFSIILRVSEFVNQYVLKHEFIKRLHQRYRQEGIEIPFPIRTVYMHQDATDGADAAPDEVG